MQAPGARCRYARLCRWIAGAVLVATVCASSGSTDAKEQPKAPPQIGRVVHVRLPITGPTGERIVREIGRAMDKAKRQNARLVLIVQFDVPKGQKNFGRGSDSGAAYSLANFLSSDKLGGVRTVAYLPDSIQGHAVLPAIACQEIIMGRDATIGAAGIDQQTITATERSAYTEIAGRRRTVPVVLALGMLDRAMEVLQVETEVGQEYVTPEGLEKLKKEHATKPPVVVKRVGEWGEFSAEQARRLGFAGFLAADRRDVVKALELPVTAVEDDPSLEGRWRAVRVDLKGPIRGDAAQRVQRMIEDQIRQNDANFICLWIDSPGGRMGDAMQLANFLALDLDPSTVRTVAYIPSEARSVAAVVALSCDQVVVYPRTVLGGSGAYEPTAREIDDWRQVIRDRLAPRKGRSWSLMAAMIDPHLTVYRATRLGQVEYFCDEELKEQLEPDKWEKGAVITTPGRPLRIDGIQADEYHLVNDVVENFAAFKQFYGLEDDPTLVEPGWADFLVRALASPGVAGLLLFIGVAALLIELQAPGTAVGGFVAAVCFLLFFWSHYLGGTAGWLEVTLFVAGVACLLLEIFVFPGFGIFGLGGGAMVLVSIVLASQTSGSIIPQNDYQFEQLQNSLLTIGAAGLGVIALAAILRKRLPRSRLFGHLMLEPPAGEEAAIIRRREALVDFRDLVGTRGTATTQLTPSGKARIGDLLVDVMADGEVIDRGAAIEVVEVRGSRVLVKEVVSG
jgi:membrane-bound serine protease (ClpP class)